MALSSERLTAVFSTVPKPEYNMYLLGWDWTDLSPTDIMLYEPCRPAMRCSLVKKCYCHVCQWHKNCHNNAQRRIKVCFYWHRCSQVCNVIMNWFTKCLNWFSVSTSRGVIRPSLTPRLHPDIAAKQKLQWLHQKFKLHSFKSIDYLFTLVPLH